MAGQQNTQSKESEKGQEKTNLLSPFEDMEHAFEEFLNKRWLRPSRWEWPSIPERLRPFEGKTPRVNVIDQDDTVLVKAEMPGVSKDNVDISVTNNTVTIHGSTKHEAEEKKENYVRHEISSGEYSRTVVLPSNVDDSKAKATFKDGLLELILPKVEKTERRKIKIES